jgi:hypothetical protein
MIEPILNKRMSERKQFITITPLRPGRQNKVARSMTIQARMEQGKVFLPVNAPWLADFLAELLKFPNGKNDDQCLVAGTLVETPQGGVPIEQISVGDMVVTPEGVKRVVNAGCTSEQATVYRVLLSNGAALVGTGNHPVMTTDGWMTIDELKYGTRVVILNTHNTRSGYIWTEKQQSTMESSGIDTQSLSRKHTDGIFRNTAMQTEALPTCIDMCGKNTTGLYRKGISFITKTATQLTTRLRTLSASLSNNTSVSTQMNEEHSRRLNSTSPISTLLGGLLRSGTLQRKGDGGTANMQKTLGSAENQQLSSASAVAKTLTHSPQQGQTTADAHAMPDIGGALTNQGQLSKLPAPSVEQASLLPNVHSVIAQSLVEQEETTATVMLKEVLPEQQAVFNLTVEDAHVYYANGILTHNCDTFSYIGLMINDVSPPAKVTPKPKASWRDKLKKLGTKKGDTWMSA